MNINTLSEAERRNLLELNPELIAEIDNPTYAEQAIAVMSNPFLIRCIDNPINEVIKFCAKSDIQSILYMDIPEDIELYILSTNSEYLEYVKTPWKPHIIEWVIQHQIYCFPFDEIEVPAHLVEKSIKHNLRNASYFKDIDPDLQRYMLSKEIKSIKCIKNLDNTVLMEFIDLIPADQAYPIIAMETTCEDARVFLKLKFGEEPPPTIDTAFYCPYIPLQYYTPHVSAFNTHIPLI